jgi:putative ABC transport system substrate-binding protein
MTVRGACRGRDLDVITWQCVRGCKNRGIVFKKAVVLQIILLFLLPAVSSQANDVVVLKSANIKPYNDALKGFKGSCGCNVLEVDLGQVGAGNISKKLAEFDPDMVLAIGMDALSRAQAVTDLPVIYAMVLPSQFPGQIKKNVSGVSMDIPPAKILGTIQEIFPAARRVGIVYDPRHSDSFVSGALYAAEQRGIRLLLKEAGRPSEVPSVIDMMRGKIDVFWMLPDVTVTTPETVKYLLLFSFQNRVPVFSFSGKYVEMGALAALNIVPFDIGVQAGEMAKKLSNGRNNGMPIRVDARKTELSVNRTVARKLGIRISDDVLRRADNVY